MTILGIPPLCGIYWGSTVLLRSLGSRRPIAVALRRAELAGAFVTPFMVPVAVVALPIMLCIYA